MQLSSILNLASLTSFLFCLSASAQIVPVPVPRRHPTPPPWPEPTNDCRAEREQIAYLESIAPKVMIEDGRVFVVFKGTSAREHFETMSFNSFDQSYGPFPSAKIARIAFPSPHGEIEFLCGRENPPAGGQVTDRSYFCVHSYPAPGQTGASQ